MTPEEARQQSFDLLADMIGMDEFQRIAAWDLLREAGDGIPAPGSAEEGKLAELGRILGERM